MIGVWFEPGSGDVHLKRTPAEVRTSFEKNHGIGERLRTTPLFRHDLSGNRTFATNKPAFSTALALAWCSPVSSVYCAVGTSQMRCERLLKE
jgi:hypothetical protein